ncbi:MAG TPA: sugar transferase [Candidatus Paceibacterota bacterium]
MRRVIHYLLAIALSILTLPIVFLASITVFACYPCNPFLLQKRKGKGNLVFTIIKLRTLRKDNQEPIRLCGGFMRKTKIDELPQFWNVVIGDMALVGPRATIVEWAELFSDQFKHLGYDIRFSVLPGVTGLAQIRGQPHDLPGNIQAVISDLEFIERMKENWLGLDLQILTLTMIYLFRSVLRKEKKAESRISEGKLVSLTNL